MHTRRILLALLLTAAFTFPIMLVSRPFAATIEPRATGAPFPGETSCAKSGCHDNSPANSGSGSVSVLINGSPASAFLYTPGETVPVTVRVADPGAARWGFQLTTRPPDGCTQAGTLAPSNSDVSILSESGMFSPCTLATIDFAVHTVAKFGPNEATFTLNWTAPSTDIGPIVFAAAGNAANGNNLPSGDRIYTIQETVQPGEGGGGDPVPAISSGGVVVANLLPTVTSISSNAIISIFGSNFAPEGTVDIEPELDGEGRVATNQRDVCVEINGDRSPILHVFPGQLNLQAPTLAPGTVGPVSVEVIAGCGTEDERRGAAEIVMVGEVAPAFFVIVFTDAGGANPIAALHGGGPDAVADPVVFPGSSAAAPGEFISLFATGFGPTEPPVMAGEIPATVLPDTFGQARLTNDIAMTIGGIPVPSGDIFYAGTAPCCAGLNQIVVKVPPSAPDGDLEVIATVAGVPTLPGPFVTVKSAQ